MPSTKSALWMVVCLGLPCAAPAATRDAATLSLPCNGCHGGDGVSLGPDLPSVAGLDARYLYKVLVQFQEGKRRATIMDRIARGYKAYELRKIANYFAARPWRGVAGDAEPGLIAGGRALHREHCAECHEDAGRYQDKETPRLAGQRPGYLQLQLLLYRRDADRMPQPTKMAERLDLVTEEDLAALSAYYGSVE